MVRGGTQTVCRSFFDGVFDVVRRFLEPLLDYWQVLKLCRFAVLTIALAAFFLIWAPQGREVLIQLQTLEDGWVTKNLWFLASVLVWAWMVWYWSRVIVSFRFPGWPPTEPPARHDLIMLYNRITPRLLGVVSILVIAIAFFSSIDGRNASGPVLGNGGFYVAIAIVFGLVTWKRISWAARLRARHPRAARLMPNPLPPGGDPRTGALYSGRYDLLPVTRQMLKWSFLLLFILPLFLFQTRPINLKLAPALGAASIVLLAAASWIAPGTLLVYWSKWHRLPILSMLFLYAALISTCNDNHAVRTITADVSAQDAKPRMEEQFRRWADHRLPEGAGRGYIPMFLVAAEGGGIRAAYWTAAVLTRIQQDQPEFGKHVFLISGVSGGSLGAAVFSGLLAGEGDAAPCADPMQFWNCSRTLLSHDYLASTLGTMLYPDLLQRFLFWPVMEEWDRGRTLEMTWEREWGKIKKDGRNVFEEPFENLWRASADHSVPNLIFNMTSVQNGKRVLLSNLRMSKAPKTECVETWTGRGTGQFDDAIDLSEALNARVCNDPPGVESSPVTVRLSTAVNNSARFSFISPAGTVNERLRIVDGGYFENSGMTTLEEVYRVLRPEVEKRNSDPNQRTKIIPIVLYLSNEPEVVTLGVRYIGPLAEDIPAVSPECIRVEVQGSDEVGRYQGRCPRPPSFSEREMALQAERSVREKLKKENYYTIRLDRDNKVVGVMEVHPIHLDEIFAPIEALFRARGARGQYAFMHLRRQVNHEQVFGTKFIRFGLRESSANLPLSWTLSTESTQEMDHQLEAMFEDCRPWPGQTLVRYFETCWPQ